MRGRVNVRMELGRGPIWALGGVFALGFMFQYLGGVLAGLLRLVLIYYPRKVGNLAHAIFRLCKDPCMSAGANVHRVILKYILVMFGHHTSRTIAKHPDD